jgi:hypothetical protein
MMKKALTNALISGTLLTGAYYVGVHARTISAFQSKTHVLIDLMASIIRRRGMYLAPVAAQDAYRGILPLRQTYIDIIMRRALLVLKATWRRWSSRCCWETPGGFNPPQTQGLLQD